jgi:phosphotransferase system HPr (HPr) family protein
MRAADRFARSAKQYTCAVAVWNGQARADGKDVWGLIALCVLPGVEVVLEVDGPDAASALDPLADILGSLGGEDYAI